MLEDQHGRRIGWIHLPHIKAFVQCGQSMQDPFWDELTDVADRLIGESLVGSATTIGSEEVLSALSKEIPDLAEKFHKHLNGYANNLPGAVGMLLWFLLSIDERACWRPEDRRPKPYRYHLVRMLEPAK
jgi:hypothetical protein